MAKVTPITEHFQHFVRELKESCWGDLQGGSASLSLLGQGAHRISRAWRTRPLFCRLGLRCRLSAGGKLWDQSPPEPAYSTVPVIHGIDGAKDAVRQLLRAEPRGTFSEKTNVGLPLLSKQHPNLLGEASAEGSSSGLMQQFASTHTVNRPQFRSPAVPQCRYPECGLSFAEWRGIVEAILGDWCEAVIVVPRFMDAAYSHFDSHYKATRTKLVQSENTSPTDQGKLALWLSGDDAMVLEQEELDPRSLME